MKMANKKKKYSIIIKHSEYLYKGNNNYKFIQLIAIEN